MFACHPWFAAMQNLNPLEAAGRSKTNKWTSVYGYAKLQKFRRRTLSLRIAKRIEMEKLTIVSVDGHAQMPPEAWPKFLAKRYHEHLPALREESASFTRISGHFMKRLHGSELHHIYDFDRAVRDGGAMGVWDRKTRIQEMDREGVAAEFITNGDNRACGLFYQSSNWSHTMELCQAGVKAYNRWLLDEFGSEPDRFPLISIVGCAPWRDMDELLAEVDWAADHGFKAVNVPGFTAYPGQPPLFDRYWDPFWARVQVRAKDKASWARFSSASAFAWNRSRATSARRWTLCATSSSRARSSPASSHAAQCGRS
jgi:hypothetical protein